jgi:hypothetical protein
MADKIIPNLPKSEAATFDDLLLVVDTPAEAPTNKKITIANLFNKIPTTIGYGTEAVGTVNVSDTTQALDGKAVFFCTGTGNATRIATMSDGTHIGQTTTIALIASTGDNVITYIQLEDGTGDDYILLEDSDIVSDGGIILEPTASVGFYDFKVTPSNFLDHTGGSNTKVNISTIGDSATLMWTGSNWIATSLVGGATTTT